MKKNILEIDCIENPLTVGEKPGRSKRQKEKGHSGLIIGKNESTFENKVKQSNIQEIVTPGKKITFQNKDKQEQSTSIITNKELASRKREKEKWAAELIIANKELIFQNKEKELRAAELIIANTELAFQNEEKEERAAELVIANKELDFQKKEKKNRAAELAIADKELDFQRKEKNKRAAELIIANKEKKDRATELAIADKELNFQKKEKKNRAEELILANTELNFQNEEKEKRAEELIVANAELAFQNTEKEKRAAELIIANVELAYQNEEKEKRAAELIIANKELIYQNKEKEKRAEELVVANEELVFEKQEKEKRAEELIISTLAEAVESKKNEEYIGHLAAIVESSDDAIISKSPDGTIKSWNRGGEKMFGYTAKEAIGKNISLIIPPDYIREEKSILEKIRNNEIVEHFETVRVKKNGTHFYVSLTVSPLKDRDGNIIGVSKIIRDITSWKKFETQLVAANERLIFQNEEKEKRARELSIANTELAFQNKEKEKRAAELVIANKELIFQNNEKEMRAAELILANTELAFQNEAKEELAAKLVSANKELAFQSSEKGKRALELETVNKELESFSYSVSHDLRAPLRAINSFAEVLVEEYAEKFDAEVYGLLNEIIENSIKMGQLIDNLLEFSRMGKQNVSMITVDVKNLVFSVIAELKQAEPSRIINVNVKNLGKVKGDKNMLKQVFVNLISNAFKYTGKKAEAFIEIGSYKENNHVIYYVKDNGAGFDMQYYDKLFGVFQRLHSNHEFEGTGVGLAIIQKIIIKHDGKVWAEGKVGEGATFYISFPDK